MPGGEKARHWSKGASLRALATAIALAAPGAALAGAAPAAPDPRALIEQAMQAQATRPATPRTVSLTAPLRWAGQVYGDVLVQVAPDGEASFESRTLRQQLEPLLNDQGRQQLDNVIAGSPFVSPGALASVGFEVRFDSAQIEVVVDSIAGNLRPPQILGDAQPTSPRELLPAMPPATFSGYLNINTNFDYNEPEGARTPDLFLNGALRYGGFVLEYDTAFTEELDDGYRFYRRGVRMVYDQRDRYRRFTAGDLRVDTLPILRTPFVGGVGVERSRQIFDPYSPAIRLGGRQIFLDTRSNVDVIINGAPYQSFQLDPGSYDLSQLPIRYGSNDVQLRIRDSAGRQQVIDINYFLDPLDLNAGDYEYTAGVGFLARNFALQPNYTNDPAFVGMYRRALSETLILGAATQISEDVQVFAGEISVVPQVIPGSFQFQGAVSTGDGTGFSGRASYRWRDGDLSRQRQFTVSIDYQSAQFRNIGFIPAPNLAQYTISASYSQALNPRLTLIAGGNYTGREGGSNFTNAFVDFVYQLNDRMRLTLGGEYGNDNFFKDNFGVRLSLTVLFGPQTRAQADYRSRTNTATASLSRGSDIYVNSWGYDLSFEHQGDDNSVSGRVNYVGNRFTAAAYVQTRGNGLGDITDDQRVRLQFGTSIAFADGHFGIGRPIADSFAVVGAHETLRDHKVIVGRDLRGNRYEASSGSFGAAVLPRLFSYSAQDIKYDVDDLPVGYDIGAGVVRVNPPLESGYSITVGNGRFVSALGNLMLDGAPAELVAGTISSTDDEGFAEQPFFTNSTGRFGVIGLAPGKTYTVRLNTGQTFTIAIPADNTGLYQMGTVDIP